MKQNVFLAKKNVLINFIKQKIHQQSAGVNEACI